MTNESTQTPATNSLARFVDIMLGYVTGRVTATYRSNDIAHKLRIDAVHIHTSTANQMEHHKSPKIHTCLYSKKEKKNAIKKQINVLHILI